LARLIIHLYGKDGLKSTNYGRIMTIAEKQSIF